jgi:hypothetical protein
MLPVETQDYAAFLRDKSAEHAAVQALDRANKNILLPCFIMAPFSVKDQEKKRQLSKPEYFDTHLGRLARSWGRRTSLLDVRFLKFDKDPQQDAADLAEFLANGLRYGCSTMPVLDLKMSELRRKAIRAHWQDTKNGLGLRITLGDLLNPKLGTMIQRILLDAVAKPQECVLILDFSDADLSDHEGFGDFEAEWVLRAQEFGLWRRTIVAATSYPEKNPAPENGQIEVQRKEWQAWKHAQNLDSRVGKLALFGDYGADNAKINFNGGGRAITHIRYAARDKWLIVRGGTPNLLGDGSLRDVAKRIILSGTFAGDLFSAGDEFLAACASGLGTIGNPTTWRAANMNHHLTRATQDIADFLNIEIPAVARRKAVQEDLFLRLTSSLG